MSTFWHLQSGEAGPTWRALPITEVVDLPFELRTVGQGSEVAMALLLSPGKSGFVNGEPLLGGLRLLNHRDEVVTPGERYYYSAQSKPLVAIHRSAPDARRLKCPVCRMAIEDGQAVVACPQCARVYHQIDAEGDRQAKHCWTYRQACMCSHPTSLADENVWRPEQEEVQHV